jgi:hypothetical protein
MVIHSDRDGNLEVARMLYDGSDYLNITVAGYGDSGESSDQAPDWEPVTDGVYCGE